MISLELVMKDYNIHGNNWIMDRLWYTDRYLLF